MNAPKSPILIRVEGDEEPDLTSFNDPIRIPVRVVWTLPEDDEATRTSISTRANPS
jgi:hypothetical protein